jgi:hypothetical protein
MGYALRSARRLIAFAFACWAIAAPLTSYARNSLLCRHQAMHQGMQHGTRSSAPCWCNDMTGSGPLILTETASLPADLIRMPDNPAPRLTIVAPPIASPPPSPSYAPTPPPPNELAA